MPVLADVAEMQRQRLNRTSVTSSREPADEVTVRFRRFTEWNGRGYQREQCAGFLLDEAKKLVRAGRADVIDPATGAVVQIDVSDPDKPGFEGRPAPAGWLDMGRTWLNNRGDKS